MDSPYTQYGNRYGIVLDGETLVNASTLVGDETNKAIIPTRPLNRSTAQAVMRDNMFVNGSKARLYRYATVMANRNITIINERLTALNFTDEGDLVWLDNVSTTKYDNITYVEDGEEKSASIPSSTVISNRAEPWVELLDEDSGDRLGIIFDKPFDNITIEGNSIRPVYNIPKDQLRFNWPLRAFGQNVTIGHVMTRSIVYAALNANESARKLWLEYDGVIETNYTGFANAIDSAGKTADFSFKSPCPDGIKVSAATLSLNVSLTSASHTTLGCDLNGHSIIDSGTPADAGNLISTDFNSSWLADGANTLSCTASGGTVTVPNMIFKTSAPHAIPRHFGGEWDYVRIAFVNKSATGKNYEFEFNATSILNAQEHTQLENRIYPDSATFDDDAEWNNINPAGCSSRTPTYYHSSPRSLNLTRSGSVKNDECIVYSDNYPLDKKKNGLISFWYNKTNLGTTDDNAFLSVIPVTDSDTLINSSATLNLTSTNGAWVKTSFAFDFSNIPDAKYFLINITLNPSWSNLTEPDNSVELFVDDVDVRTGTDYILLDENGMRCGVNDADGGDVSLDVSLKDVANKTYTLLYTDDLTYEHNDFITEFGSSTPTTGWSDPCKDDLCRNVIDSGVWAQKFFRLPPASETSYTPKNIPAGVNTETVEKVVIDPETGMGSIISITAWSKAGGLRE